MANFDMTGLAESLSPPDEAIVGGNAYTVAGERSTIEEIIRNCGSKIIGEFHKTIDVNGKIGICYIQKPKENNEKMLEEFRKAKILVWPEKKVKPSTNGYELDLTNKAHLQFAKDNKDVIRFLGPPEIKNNIKEHEFPTEIFYKFPNNGCYCMPEDDPVAVGTPNMCAMGVKIDTVKDTNIKNNQQISKEDLEKILNHHHEKTVLPKQKSKGIKTEKK